jgi:hypothetical protein
MMIQNYLLDFLFVCYMNQHMFGVVSDIETKGYKKTKIAEIKFWEAQQDTGD